MLGFVMLNPSRADAWLDDPTIRRCLGLAKQWNYGGMAVANLFAYRTSKPKDLRQVADPVGPENNRYLLHLGQGCDRLILAWGNAGTLQDRGRTVTQLLGRQRPLWCLGLTQAGQPCHPLYLPRTVQPVPLDCR